MSIDEAKEREAAYMEWARASYEEAPDPIDAFMDGWLAHARASRPREAKCPACGGVGEHVEGKRGFTRFPCPNAAPPVAPEACPVACPDADALVYMANTMRLAIKPGCVNVGVHPSTFLALLERAIGTATPAPTEAEVEECARVLADANCDYCEPKTGFEGKRFGVDLPEHFCDMYRHMARVVLAHLRKGAS